MSVETTLRALIKNHQKRLINNKLTFDFKQIPLEHQVENFFINGIKLPSRTSFIEWVVLELIKEPKDILLVPNEDVLRSFKDFKNPIYKDVPQSTFESIVERIHVSGVDLEKVYNESNYKILVMDYNNTRFRVKLSKYIAKNFPRTETVIGIN